MTAVPFDDETKANIQDDLKQYVRSLIKGGSQFKQTRVLASEKLKEISAAYGLTSSVAAVFSLPNSSFTMSSTTRPFTGTSTTARQARMTSLASSGAMTA